MKRWLKVKLRMIKNGGHFVLAVGAWLIYGQKVKQLRVIGVTGTDGKTTTSRLIFEMLAQNGDKVGLINTVGAYIGDQEIDTGFHVTTPGVWQLYRLMAKMADLGYKYVVVEATSHGLDQHRLWGIEVETAVLTNISHEHLDYHLTIEAYTRAKLKLFNKAKVAILNQDDTSYQSVVRPLLSKVKVIGYSQKRLTDEEKGWIFARFPQSYNRDNAAAAIALAHYYQIEARAIRKAIEAFKGVKGRMEEIQNNKGIKAVVDFAHTPRALESVLTALRSDNRGKLIAVFGAAGERDKSKRPLMGKIASKLADEVILTAEDPRGEQVRVIIEQIMAGVSENFGHIHKIADRKEAIELAVKIAKKGDTIALLGKGHEQSMCFGKIEHKWSDQEALAEALKEKP